MRLVFVMLQKLSEKVQVVCLDEKAVISTVTEVSLYHYQFDSIEEDGVAPPPTPLPAGGGRLRILMR
jgi:hypothetical protein